MKLIKIIFIFLFTIGILWGCYNALFNGASGYIDAATAGNETFIAGTSTAFPVIWILGILALCVGVIVYALKRRSD